LNKKLKIKIENLEFNSFDFFSNIKEDDWKYVLDNLDTDVNEVIQSGVYEIINERIGELMMEKKNG
jgi:hypothetical protein